MRRLTVLTWSLALATALQSAPYKSPVQDPRDSTDGPTEVVLTKLSTPIYPPLARQAHITGDVDVAVSVRRDGSVESASVVRGHALLQEVGLDSARRSQFECRKCREETTSYRLTYTFQLTESGECCTTNTSNPDKTEAKQIFPHVAQSENHVTVVDRPVCICDPAIDRVRSLKCLYLWRCGYR
jgi:TonB family protein